MEGDAIGIEAGAVRMLEHVDGHLRRAAELPRQRPLGADAVAEDAAEDAGSRGGAGDLVGLLDAVDGEHADAAREGGGDVALLLDGVAEGDAVRGRAGGERHVDLGHGGAVERRAELGEELQHGRIGVRLDRIEDAAVGERLRKRRIVLAHDIEVDDEAGALGASESKKVADTVSHSQGTPQAGCG